MWFDKFWNWKFILWSNRLWSQIAKAGMGKRRFPDSEASKLKWMKVCVAVANIRIRSSVDVSNIQLNVFPSHLFRHIMLGYLWYIFPCKIVVIFTPQISGYEMKLTIWRLWVWISVPYTGWTIFTFDLFKKLYWCLF